MEGELPCSPDFSPNFQHAHDISLRKSGSLTSRIARRGTTIKSHACGFSFGSNKRKDSRTRRLARLRSVARRKVFLVTFIPKRRVACDAGGGGAAGTASVSPSPQAAHAEMSLPLTLRFCANTRSKSACVRRVGRVLRTRRTSISSILCLYEAHAAFLAATREYFAPTRRFHAGTEAEFADAF